MIRDPITCRGVIETDPCREASDASHGNRQRAIGPDIVVQVGVAGLAKCARALCERRLRHAVEGLLAGILRRHVEVTEQNALAVECLTKPLPVLVELAYFGGPIALAVAIEDMDGRHNQLHRLAIDGDREGVLNEFCGAGSRVGNGHVERRQIAGLDGVVERLGIYWAVVRVAQEVRVALYLVITGEGDIY